MSVLKYFYKELEGLVKYLESVLIKRNNYGWIVFGVMVLLPVW